MNKVKNIAEGWIKYILGGVADEWAKDRVMTCISNNCKMYEDKLYPMCKKCKCHIKAKAVVKSEKCPLGYWKE